MTETERLGKQLVLGPLLIDLVALRRFTSYDPVSRACLHGSGPDARERICLAFTREQVDPHTSGCAIRTPLGSP